MIRSLGTSIDRTDVLAISLGSQHSFLLIQGGNLNSPLVVPYSVLLKAIASSIDLPSGTAAWGSIATGTGVGSQTDLVTYLNANYIDPTELSSALSNYVPTSRTLTINGTTYDLSANRSWTISGGGAVDSVNGQTGVVILELNDIDDVNAPSPTVGQVLQWNGTEWVAATITGTGTVTSVAATVPSPTNPAFSVAVPNPTTTPSVDITANGIVSQYIRGDGSLANFPSSGGGGSSLNYYLNGSVSQGTLGGVAFRQMSSTPVIGAGTNFSVSSDGYIQSFITDASVPNQLLIPAGNWLFEMYFQSSSSGGSPRFYIELYKLSGGTLSLIASSVANPEFITNGTQVDLYTTAVAVPSTVLLAADRIAVRVYVITSGRTITLHTEDSNLCEVITTFSTGITALNGLTAQIQNFATGTSGTDFGITSAADTHTFNLPTASATNRGALSSADWTVFNGKQNALTTTKSVKILTNNVELDGDAASPGNQKYYGTDLAGTKGFYSFPSGNYAIIVKAVNGTPITGTTNAISLSGLVPANTNAANDILRVKYRISKIGTAAATTTRLYVNTTNSLSGATLLAQVATAAATRFLQSERELFIKNGLTITEVWPTTSAAFTDNAVASTPASVIAINHTVDQYYFVALQNGITGEISTCEFLRIERT